MGPNRGPMARGPNVSRETGDPYRIGYMGVFAGKVLEASDRGASFPQHGGAVSAGGTPLPSSCTGIAKLALPLPRSSLHCQARVACPAIA
jgi:hypothetical protein